MAQSTNVLTAVINRQDANGVNVENRSIGASFAGAAGEFEIRSAPDTSSHSLDLPIALVLQAYIKNTHATANLKITATPQGGASAVVVDLGPGDVFIVWSAGTSATRGYSAISYQADTTGCTFEYFFGG